MKKTEEKAIGSQLNKILIEMNKIKLNMYNYKITINYTNCIFIEKSVLSLYN